MKTFRVERLPDKNGKPRYLTTVTHEDGREDLTVVRSQPEVYHIVWVTFDLGEEPFPQPGPDQNWHP